MGTRLGHWIAGLALLLATSASAGEELTATIEVRDGTTRTALAGATVYSVSQQAFLEVRQPWRFDHGDMLAMARRVGVRTVTDEAGIARVSPSLFKYGWFVVEHEGMFGAGSWYDPDLEEPHRIDVFPDAAVRVKLLASDGSPAAGMPVSLRRPSDDMYPWIWQGVTDGKGEATVTHVPWRLERIRAATGRLVVEIPGVEVQATVSVPAGETPMVTLQLPPLGRLRVAPTGAGPQGELW